jgi:hypothetical protein
MEKLLPATISTEQWSVIPPPSTDLLRVKAVTEIVYQVEAIKQMNPPMTDPQRDALIRILCASDWPVHEIAMRGMRVAQGNTFNRLAYEFWCDHPEETLKVTVRGDCIYCGAEWWGPVGMKCPTCFPK